ncbi:MULTISPECIES: hypothetical protein [unclassified Crossiella]|nr:MULTISPECIES: hypothetical protein [unclassified Crossiella]MCK2238619.1 hypothetical protein [Crossiella sp. S99.2]MCK2251811.1 hypothetical protein [Crossiella sp. S99.1]
MAAGACGRLAVLIALVFGVLAAWRQGGWWRPRMAGGVQGRLPASKGGRW